MGQRPGVDGNGEYPCGNAGTHAKRRILDDQCLPGLQAAHLRQSHQVGIGIGLAALHVVGRDDVLFVEVLTEVLEQAVDEWTLPAARHHANA